jgi:hypothetical protein
MSNVACKLDAEAKSIRGGEWRELRAAGLLDAKDGNGFVTTRWKPELRGPLTALIDAERDCCSFLGFELEDAGDAIVLRISAPPLGLETARRLAGLAR